MNYQFSNKEIEYHRKQMYENMKVYGIPATIDSINDEYEESYDFYNDIDSEDSSFDNSIQTWLTYEEVPTVSTLKSLGWYLETEEFPIIAYIPILYLKRDGTPANFRPAVDDKVTLVSNPMDENSSERKFLIKDFKGKGFPHTIYYIVKLVPFRVDEL